MNDNILKIVIVDDEEAAIDNLCFELRRFSSLNVVGIAHNGSAGIRLVEKERPDLRFLDVELPDMLGMDAAVRLRRVTDWNMHIVFYTAYDKYLIDALRNFAFDFLLKPVDSAELDIVVDRILSASQSEDAERQLPVKGNECRLPASEKSFMVVTPTGPPRNFAGGVSAWCSPSTASTRTGVSPRDPTRTVSPRCCRGS